MGDGVEEAQIEGVADDGKHSDGGGGEGDGADEDAFCADSVEEEESKSDENEVDGGVDRHGVAVETVVKEEGVEVEIFSGGGGNQTRAAGEDDGECDAPPGPAPFVGGAVQEKEARAAEEEADGRGGVHGRHAGHDAAERFDVIDPADQGDHGQDHDCKSNGARELGEADAKLLFSGRHGASPVWGFGRAFSRE